MKIVQDKSLDCWKHNIAFKSSLKVFSIPNGEERNTFLCFFHVSWFLGFLLYFMDENMQCLSSVTESSKGHCFPSSEELFFKWYNGN